MASLRKFTRNFFVLLNGIVCVLFLLCCCNAFLHPDKWWFISLLGFLFPLFLLINIGFLVFWLFLCRRYIVLSLITLLIGWKNIHAFFGFSLAKKDFPHKSANSIRVLTWNVRRWDEFINKKIGSSGHRLRMMDQVAAQQPDLLCFQEFYEPLDPARSNILYIQNQLHFPYHFFSSDYHSSLKNYETGVVIFSRYPITGTIQRKYNPASPSRSESLIEADIRINDDTIRVCTTHLQSVLFKSKDFRDVEIIQNANDSMLEASRSLAHKLSYALRLRGFQADTVRRNLDSSPYPVIMCGDFNDVPNSYTYFRIRGGLQDAYNVRSFGIGRTYINISPTLRIDYILADKKFTVVQSERLISPYSDHHAVIADLELRAEKR
jgi:endonuclease/exonuclease/phosphatase family metal-dependent hydrolase